MAQGYTSAEVGKRLAGKKSGPLCVALFEETPDAIFFCSEENRLLLVNPAFRTLMADQKGASVGCAATDLDPPELGALVLEQNAAVIASGKTRTFEVAMVLAGRLRTFLVTKGRCLDGAGTGFGVFSVARDISESRATEQEIIDSSDREKQRLGRELRENFCQHLVGISLLGNVLYEELSRVGIEQAKYARQIVGLVKEVVSEVRTLEKGLSVTHLEQGEGLVEALEDLAEQVRSPGKIACRFHPPAIAEPLDSQLAMYLFRIAQEAVHNAVIHSQAQRLQIRLTLKPDAIVLSVRDDGVGFSGEDDAAFTLRSRIGFPVMRSRSRAIGAKLEIKHLRHGLEVVCTVPRRKMRRRGDKGDSISTAAGG